MTFLSAAGLLLVVILLFALVPGGSPHSRNVGSAFDPSTSVVSLKESSRQVEVEKAVANSGKKPDRAAAGKTPHPSASALIDEPEGMPISARGQPPLDAPFVAAAWIASVRARAPPKA